MISIVDNLRMTSEDAPPAEEECMMAAADLIEKLDTSLREIARRGDLFPDLKQQIENMIVDIERA